MMRFLIVLQLLSASLIMMKFKNIYSLLLRIISHPVTWIVCWVILVGLTFYFVLSVSGYFLALAGASAITTVATEAVVESVGEEVKPIIAASSSKGTGAIINGIWALGNFLVKNFTPLGIVHPGMFDSKPRFFGAPHIPGDIPKNLDWDVFSGSSTTVSTVVGVSGFMAVIHNLISSGFIDFTAMNSVAASVQLPVVPSVPSAAPESGTTASPEAPSNPEVPSAPIVPLVVHGHGMDFHISDVDSVTKALYMAQFNYEMGMVSANDGLADINSIISSAKTLGDSVPVDAVRGMGPLGSKFAADIVGLPHNQMPVYPRTDHLLSRLDKIWDDLHHEGAEGPEDFWSDPYSIAVMSRVLEDYYWGNPEDKDKPPL